MERTLYPSKTWPIFGVAAFGTLALLLALTGSWDARGGAFVLLIGALIFAAHLLPNAVYLKLTRAGFEYKNVLPARFVKWDDVECFTTYRYRYTHCVGWVYRGTTSVSSSVFLPPFWPWRLLPLPVKRFLSIAIDDGFTVNFKLKDADALASLLEQWRKEHDTTTWVSIGRTPP